MDEHVTISDIKHIVNCQQCADALQEIVEEEYISELLAEDEEE